MNLSHLFAFILILFCFEIVYTCNNHELKVNYLRNCNGDSLVKIKNITLNVDKNCVATVKGCVTISKPFKTAIGKYRLKKIPMPDVTGEVDICKLISDGGKSKLGLVLSAIGLKCPGEAKMVCSNGNKIDISKYKNQIPMIAGKTEIKIDIEHNSGKTCIELGVEIKNMKALG